MAVNPYDVPVSAQSGSIGGSLNFGQVPKPDDYMAAYGNALSLNQQNYANILGGYQSSLQSQQAMQQGIQQGYATLSSNVLNTIQGIDASQRQAIRDTYAQQAGSTAQSLINRGLGNTTVANSMQRGLLADRQKADIALSNQTAQLNAGYQSNLGLAGLNYANQANTQNTALRSQQLGFMNSVNSPYPNAQAYSQLAQQKGAVKAGTVGAGGMGGMTMSAGRGGGGGVLGYNGGSNQTLGTMAPYTPMANRSGAQGARYQEPLTNFGQEEAPPDPYQMGRDYASQNPMSQPEEPYYAENFMNETPGQGGTEDTGAYNGADYGADDSFQGDDWYD